MQIIFMYTQGRQRRNKKQEGTLHGDREEILPVKKNPEWDAFTNVLPNI